VQVWVRLPVLVLVLVLVPVPVKVQVQVCRGFAGAEVQRFRVAEVQRCMCMCMCRCRCRCMCGGTDERCRGAVVQRFLRGSEVHVHCLGACADAGGSKFQRCSRDAEMQMQRRCIEVVLVVVEEEVDDACC
jgi:hypothetical protein